jgi:hypothetical protein
MYIYKLPNSMLKHNLTNMYMLPALYERRHCIEYPGII